VDLKAEGVKAGVSDIHLPIPIGDHAGLWIEMKYGRNKPTETQIAWMELMEYYGHRTEVAYGATQAIEILEDYLEIGA